MDNQSIYDLAYTFKKSKLWQLIREQQIFAVRLPDGQIGYCLIMGQNGEHMALSLHIGAEGFSSYRRLNDMDGKAVPFQYLCHISRVSALGNLNHHINDILGPYSLNGSASDMTDSDNRLI